MTWSRNVGRGNETFYFNEMLKEIANKQIKKTKLKVCLQYLKIANSLKRMYARGFKRESYPDSYEYYKLLERKRKYAKKIIFVIKNIRKNNDEKK